MARQDLRHVFQAGLTLNERLGQVAHRTHKGNRDTGNDTPPPGSSQEAEPDHANSNSRQGGACEAFPGLLRGQRWSHGVFAEHHAGSPATGVVGDHHQLKDNEHPGVMPRRHHEHHERGQERHVDGRKR